MSTIRRVSAVYRAQRQKKREVKAAEARAAQEKLFETMLKAGQIKPPPPMRERNARMVLPRERLVELWRGKWTRLTGFLADKALAATALRAHGHRSGWGQPYEVQRLLPEPYENGDRLPRRNKTWGDEDWAVHQASR